MFDITENKENHQLKMMWDKGAEPDIYFYDVKKEKGEAFLTTGYQWDASVITGIGKTVEESVNRLYEYVDMFHAADIYYRPKSDFLSMSYRTSIMNRLEFVKKHNYA